MKKMRLYGIVLLALLLIAPVAVILANDDPPKVTREEAEAAVADLEAAVADVQDRRAELTEKPDLELFDDLISEATTGAEAAHQELARDDSDDAFDEAEDARSAVDAALDLLDGRNRGESR